MKSFLQTTSNICNSINEQVGRLVSWLTLVLVILVCFNVVSRKAFDIADAWRGELEWHLFALIFLLGAGYAFKHNRHVRVDLFYANYSKKDKAWTNLAGALLFLVPWCVLIIYFSFGFAQESFAINEISPNPNGLKYRYLIKFAIPVGVGFLLIQAIGSIAESLIVLLNKNSNETEVTE